MKYLSISLFLIAALGIDVNSAFSGGFKGGGGGRGGGGFSGGGGRPASMPHMGGGVSRPSMPAARPSVSRPTVSRPSLSRPNVSSPGISRPSLPAARPSLPAARPSVPQKRPSLPNAGLPNASRPNLGGGITGGMKPSLPSAGNRPTRLPGNVAGNRPGSRPSTLPGNLPSTKPSFPSLGGGGSSRPGNLPGAGNRPSTLPGLANRPLPGDIGDFLGIPGGLKPSERPGIANRPTTLPGKLPNLADRPNTLPGQNRPGLDLPGSNRPGGRPTTLPSRPVNLPTGIPGRPGANTRPINLGNINVGNTVINNRPSWVNIDNNRINSINNRWQTQVGGLHGWATTNPGRVGYWNGWGNNVRGHWHSAGYHGRWFAGDWWYGHPGGVCRWHYYHRFNNYPWNYWWRRPAWAVTSSWFAWSAPANVWSQPIYYDYGTGGNVTYENNNVYVSGQPVASVAEFAESAAALATVEPPASDEQADAAEWLPLGTFALSTSEADTEPSRVVQLAVDKSGIISGTMYNRQTDQADAVQGRVDKETQRVAFRLGESDTIVAETGIYNLTQDEAPLLVHFGADRVENYVLVRLEQPAETDAESGTAAGN